MAHSLSTIKAFFIPLKIEPYQVESLKRGLEEFGGETCMDQANANVILTALTSAPRVKRHLKNHKIPVVNVDWLKECLKKHEEMSMDKYKIHLSRSEATQPSKAPEIQLPRSREVLNRRYSEIPPDPLPPEEEQEKLPNTSSSEIAEGFLNTRYECLRNTPLEAFHNRKLVFLLKLLERQRILDMEDKNALSYRHAIAAFKAYPRSIQSADEARKITGIGKKISELVRIYLETGTIPDAEKLLGDEKFRTCSLFCKVFGVGPSTANIWWDRGYRTLQEILDQAKLVKAVKLGIELLPDLEQPISRQDAQELIEIIEKEIAQVDPEAFVTPVGGYRRGKEENGDLDVVISSHHLKHGSDMLLRKIVDHLTAKGYIKHCLLLSDKANRNQGNHYTTSGADMEKLDTCFVAFLQPSTQILRQVDFIVASLDEYPSAVLGWTGSKQFERALKDYAKKEHGIAVRSHGIFKEKTKERIQVESEEQAFDIIRLPWVDPTMRNC